MSYTTGSFDIDIYAQKKDDTSREESENYTTKLKKKLGIQNHSDTIRIRELEINEQIEALRSKFINIISTKYYENCDWLSEIVYHFLKYYKSNKNFREYYWMNQDNKTVLINNNDNDYGGEYSIFIDATYDKILDGEGEYSSIQSLSFLSELGERPEKSTNVNRIISNEYKIPNNDWDIYYNLITISNGVQKGVLLTTSKIYNFLEYVKNKWITNDKKIDPKFRNRLKILEYYVHNTYHNIQPSSNSLTYSQINSFVSGIFGLSVHIEPEYRVIGGRGYVGDDEEFYGINIIFQHM